jgi:uncharacterized protein YbjT (DUF2867 family)
MSLQDTTPSPQQRQHWLSEQALSWSGLPVVTIRPTVFLDGFFLRFVGPIVRERNRIELPFGLGRTPPVSAADAANVVANGIAREHSEALGREITYLDVLPMIGYAT